VPHTISFIMNLFSGLVSPRCNS